MARRRRRFSSFTIIISPQIRHVTTGVVIHRTVDFTKSRSFFSRFFSSTSPYYRGRARARNSRFYPVHHNSLKHASQHGLVRLPDAHNNILLLWGTHHAAPPPSAPPHPSLVSGSHPPHIKTHGKASSKHAPLLLKTVSDATSTSAVGGKSSAPCHPPDHPCDPVEPSSQPPPRRLPNIIKPAPPLLLLHHG